MNLFTNFHLASISCVVLAGCKENVPFSAKDLIGKVAVEHVEIPKIHYIDSAKTWFEQGNKYIRSEGMYVQTEGYYEVCNDTLEIHYDCQDKCDNSTCGIQQYVMGTDGKLHLIYMRDRDGIPEDLTTTPFDKVLEIQNH